MKRLDVLYEDETCIVLDKPSGLPSQAGAGVTVSLDALLARAYSFSPCLVHRLDKASSGLILVAKSPEHAAYYCRVLGEKKALKQYCAVSVRDADAAALPPEGVFDSELRYRSGQKSALTRYRIRGAAELSGISFVRFELELGTGRTHQIRRHLAQAGYPIAADDKYGNFARNRELKARFSLKRLLLHSERLRLPLFDGRLLDIRAPLPSYFLPFQISDF
jgi:23S rRNA pseudouridine955/2504/2580 synthase